MEPKQPLRLAELLAALSLETDLAMGHPADEAMRVCLFATGVARRRGLSEREVADVYWTALLMHVGCTAFSHEQAALFGGDEVAVNDIGSSTDPEQPRELFRMLLGLTRNRSALERARIFVTVARRGAQFGRDLATAACEVASQAAERLGLGSTVQEGMDQLFERWNGKGGPQGLAGEAIALPARLGQIAAQIIVFERLSGAEAALELVRRRAGSWLDPELVEDARRYGPELLAEIAGADPCEAVLAAEPKPWRMIAEDRIDGIAHTFADLVDLKSVYTLGHSTRVAELAEEAGRETGLAEKERTRLRRAGFLHDIGKVGVPNGIWEKPGPLTAAEWERVRLHPYHSERILARSPALEPLAAIAGMHHERLDGSGYFRRCAAAAQPMSVRLLAAADHYAGRTQERAHRPALSPSDAVDDLAREAREGRLDAEAVEAVLAAAGHDHADIARKNWPAGLTDREVEVLRLVARGLSNREIARKLYISPKTAGRHVENIYGKLEVSSRPAAALFAVHHDLLGGSG